jgi:NAD(P)-dependent dehydrogenase (short-subunit alcohol dehydrogenase family)
VGLFNAGLNKPRFFMDIDEDNWDMIMNVNTKAMWLGMQETARQMIAQGPQDKPYKLINVGSIASRKPLVDVTVYCTSKYGCLALTECGALGLAEHNITVNGYAPGVVVTPLWEQLDKDLVEIGFKEREGQAYDDIVETNLVIKRVSYPDDITGHGLVPGLRRQRLHDRPDDLHRWRLGHEVDRRRPDFPNKLGARGRTRKEF